MLHLKDRTTREWFKELRKIKNKVVRVQVANIIWYDYASLYLPRCRLWNAYLCAWRRHHGASPRNVRKALKESGYTDAMAKRRSTIPIEW
jgi:hypothetical protein